MADSSNGTVYVRKGADGKTQERTAYTPREQVQLEFDGWTAKTTSQDSKSSKN